MRREHYIRLENIDMRRKAKCGCELRRSPDDGSVSLFLCRAHEQVKKSR